MQVRLTSTLAALALMAACAKGDNATADTAKMAADTTHKDTAAMTPPAAPALNDANIAAILDGANVADSSAGAIAATKATGAEVKTFAKEMMKDHHMLRQQGLDLVKKLGVTPVLPAGDHGAADSKAWNDSLTAMPKGAAWDKSYIDHEVAYHQAVLATANTALGAAQNAELKALITKAAPAIQGHLDHAKLIQGKLK